MANRSLISSDDFFGEDEGNVATLSSEDFFGTEPTAPNKKNYLTSLTGIEEEFRPPGIKESIKGTLPEFKKDSGVLNTIIDVAKTAALPLSLPLTAASSVIRKIPGVEPTLQTSRRGLSGISKVGEELLKGKGLTEALNTANSVIKKGTPFFESFEDSVTTAVNQGKDIDDYRSPSVLNNLF